jgi:RNA polymerase sigma-70 factor (ECF subfamily)
MNAITLILPRAPDPQYEVRPRSEELVSLIPKLRAFARMLCLDSELAESLAQKAFERAWARQCRIDNAANLTTGLFRIFHEEFHAHRKASAAQLALDLDTTSPDGADDPDCALGARITRAMAAMSDNQREALILVSAAGFSSDDASEICGAQPKTVKSRATRARNMLFKVLKSDHALAKSGDVSELWTGAAV